MNASRNWESDEEIYGEESQTSERDYDVREEKEKYNILTKESWLWSGRPKK